MLTHYNCPALKCRNLFWYLCRKVKNESKKENGLIHNMSKNTIDKYCSLQFFRQEDILRCLPCNETGPYVQLALITEKVS